MKTFNIILNTVLTVIILGCIYLLFEPSFDIIDKLYLTYLIFISVFAIYLDYNFRNNQF